MKSISMEGMGKWVRSIRESLGLSREELEGQIGVSIYYLAEVEIEKNDVLR